MPGVSIIPTRSSPGLHPPERVFPRALADAKGLVSGSVSLTGLAILTFRGNIWAGGPNDGSELVPVSKLLNSSASYLRTSPSNFSQLYLVEGPGGFAPQFAPAFRPAFPRSSPRSSPTISPRSPRNSLRTPRPFSHGNRYDDERAGQVVETKDGPDTGA